MGKYPLIDNGRVGLEIGVRVALRLLGVKRQACGARLYGLSVESVLKRLDAWIGLWPLQIRSSQYFQAPSAGQHMQNHAAAMEEQTWNSIHQH
jgi:hypothetical protein